MRTSSEPPTNDADSTLPVLLDEYRRLIRELHDIDERYRNLLGDEYDMMHGAGVHRDAESIDTDFRSLDRLESNVLNRLAEICSAIQRAGGTAKNPDPRKDRPGGPYFGFDRDW